MLLNTDRLTGSISKYNGALDDHVMREMLGFPSH
jgi:hypothetical protein